MPRAPKPRVPVRPPAAPAPRPLTALDPTTLSDTYYVRHPRPSSFYIQGRYRHPRSDAAKRFLTREKGRIRNALDHLTHGKDIFAYNHIRTNQVIYSLSRSLRVSICYFVALFLH